MYDEDGFRTVISVSVSVETHVLVWHYRFALLWSHMLFIPFLRRWRSCLRRSVPWRTLWTRLMTCPILPRPRYSSITSACPGTKGGREHYHLLSSVPLLKIFLLLPLNGLSYAIFNRYLFAYLNYRMDHVRELRWETGAVLPAHVQPKLSPRENDFFMEYNNLINDYCTDCMVDLASDMEVQKDLMLILNRQGRWEEKWTSCFKWLYMTCDIACLTNQAFFCCVAASQRPTDRSARTAQLRGDYDGEWASQAGRGVHALLAQVSARPFCRLFPMVTWCTLLWQQHLINVFFAGRMWSTLSDRVKWNTCTTSNEAWYGCNCWVWEVSILYQ